MIEGGIGLPSNFVSSGLLSKSSSCDGAPAMNMWITAFAFGCKCGAAATFGLLLDP